MRARVRTQALAGRVVARTRLRSSALGPSRTARACPRAVPRPMQAPR